MGYIFFLHFDVLSLLESDVRLTYFEFDVLSMVHIRFEQIRSSLIRCLRIGLEEGYHISLLVHPKDREEVTLLVNY